MELSNEYLNSLYQKVRPVVERKCRDSNVTLRDDQEAVYAAFRKVYEYHLKAGLEPDKLPGLEGFLTALMVQTWFALCNT